MTIITAAIMLGRKKLGVKQADIMPVADCTIGDIPFIRQADPRYVDLSFLAAHDANTGIAGYGEKLEPAASKALVKYEPLVRNYLDRFMKTQTVSVYELLRFGCRFLHIKVTQSDGEWYTSHSVLTGKLRQHTEDILRFLSERKNAGEIVTVLLQPIYLADKSLADLHEYLAGVTYEGKSLFDYVRYGKTDELKKGEGVRVGDLRYSDIVGENNENGVVLFERRDQHYKPSWDARETAYPYFFDMDAHALHVWHNHSDTRLIDDGMARLAEEILSSGKYSDVLRLNQTQVSSSFKTVRDFFTSLYARSLLKTAERHNAKLIARPDFDRILKAMPVFQVDYLTSGYEDFNRRVNLAIRKYNEELVRGLV